MSQLRALLSFLAVAGLVSVLVYWGKSVMRRRRRRAEWKREMDGELSRWRQR
jgi:hypothetical protein